MSFEHVGLKTDEARKLGVMLNEVLANYQVFYQNVRGYHWNIKGENFFSLHQQFEDLYNRAHMNIDEIAERILTLEETPLHAFSDYIERSKIKEARNVSDGRKAAEGIVNGYGTLIELEREVINFADEAGDEATADMLTSYISEQEKSVWMFESFLG